jgi:hypothetical protein
VPLEKSAPKHHCGTDVVIVISLLRLAFENNIPVALDAHTLEYHPKETARLTTDPVLQREVRRMSIRALAKVAGVSDRTVKAARRGQRLRKSTIQKLKDGLKDS